MTTLTQISSGQSQKEVTANGNFDAVSPAGLFGRRAASTSGLTWGYFGGMIDLDGTPTTLADGTVTLRASVTEYVELMRRVTTSKTITAVSIAADAVITSTAHGYQPGDIVYISGVSGTVSAVLNGYFHQIKSVADANTYTIETSTSGFAYTSGGSSNLCGETGTTLQVGKGVGGFTAGSYIGYVVVTGTSTISSYTDHRRTWMKPYSGHLAKSVAGSSNVILSAVEARPESLEFTGALTGNISVIFPAMVGTWMLYNNTTGAFSLTVKGPNSTGIVIPQGKRVMVMSDGSTFLGTENYLSVLLASANQAALTDSTTGTPSATLNDVTAVHDQAILNNNFASLLVLVNQLRSDLVTAGIIKGSA